MDQSDFDEGYFEIEKNFARMIKKRKTIHSKTFFLCLNALHVAEQAKAYVIFLKESGEWEKMPVSLSSFLEDISNVSSTFANEFSGEEQPQ
jgi:hypothetical protein